MDNFILLKPADENVFEDLVSDMFMRRYKTYNFQRFGKKGQSQYGVDAVGPVDGKIIGVQSKNHPETKAKISVSEIDKEIEKSEKFTPALSEYYIITSAGRDTVAESHVLSISQQRQKDGKYPVYIYFWEDVCHYLQDYPDLVYKYFNQHFLKEGIQNLTNYQFTTNKNTIFWPIDKQQLLSNISTNLAGITSTSQYTLLIGLSSFKDVDFSGVVDVSIPLPDTTSLIKASEVMDNLKSLINSKGISRDIIVFPQIRLSQAFIFGWIFRKVSGHRLILSLKEKQVWRSFDLPYVDPKVVEDLPILLDSQSKEIALVFNVSRNIQNGVIKHFGNGSTKPLAILGYSVEGNSIISSAQALSVSLHFARLIKNMIDKWGVTKIHLFSAMPVGLAILIGYHLNGICPIALYHMDDQRKNYVLSGEITNNL